MALGATAAGARTGPQGSGQTPAIPRAVPPEAWESPSPVRDQGRRSTGAHAMLAAWRSCRPRPARRRKAEHQPRVAGTSRRLLCSLLFAPRWKHRLDPKRLNPQRSTGSSRTFAILGFYWLLKAFSCIQQLGSLIKYAFFSALVCTHPLLLSSLLPLKTGACASVSQTEANSIYYMYMYTYMLCLFGQGQRWGWGESWCQT